jgi:cytochrome c oxidase subunit 2
MLLGSLFGVLAAAAGILFLHPPAWFPASITHAGEQYDSQFSLTLWISGLIFLFAHLLLIGVAFRFHSRPLHPRWETAGTFVATLLFTTLAFTGTRIWAGVHTDPIPVDAERIEVLARQFAWNFRYPGPDGKLGRTSLKHVNDPAGNPFGIDPADPAGRDDIVTATLKVPAGRDIVLTLHARDVIHDFFVRELRLKQDAVPGMEIPYRFHAETPGIYEIACSELCGLGHSQMRSTVEVMPVASFEQWKHGHGL